MSEKLLKEAK